jgi:hypothetical protein
VPPAPGSAEISLPQEILPFSMSDIMPGKLSLIFSRIVKKDGSLSPPVHALQGFDLYAYA